MEQQTGSILCKTVKWLTKSNKINICIHDTSGILHNNSELTLPLKYSIHSGELCDHAKTTAEGLRACLRCKSASIRKAVRLKSAYSGECYMGITEIVKPVYFEETLICLIFVGNIVRKNRDITDCIAKSCRRTGVDIKKAVELINTTEKISEDQMDEYNEITDILEQIILSAVNKNTRFKNGRESLSPIYTKAGNWVVEMLQNYVASYYDRDIRISQLAKLYFLNAQYLSRVFRRETGTHFSDYVNRVRVDNSKHLLEHTEDEIILISQKVGFNNVTYYNRLFRKYTGMSPGDWRKYKD